MAFAIGDYIHYTNQGYQDFGITQKGPAKGDAAYESRYKILDRAREQQKIHSRAQKDIKGLESFLNTLIYPEEKKSKNQIDQKVFSQFQKMVQQAFQEKWGFFNIDMRHLHVYKTKKIAETQQSISTSSLQSYSNQLTVLVERLGTKKDTEKDVQEIKKIIKKIEIIAKQNNPDAEIDLTIKKNKDLIAEINYALSLATFNYKMLGDAFEIWLAGAAELANYESQNTSKELLQDFCKDLNKKVSGGNTAKSVVSVANVSAEFVDKEAIKQPLIDSKWSLSDTVDVITKSSQQKTDMTFNWKGTPLQVSAKNYSLKDDGAVIHLLSGTSLYQILLSGSLSASYVNHFLNIVTTNDKSSLQYAHNNLKLIILAQALTGQGLKDSGMSDTFIINARSKKHIYVFTMNQIFKAYSKTPEAINIGNTLSITQSLEPGGPKDRITKLIASLHAEKLNVSIKASNIIPSDKQKT